MYMIDNMVDLGLPEGIVWPSEFHKTAAIKILINNPEINTMDLLQSGVINILNIPIEKLPTLMLEDLPRYGFDIHTTIRPRAR